MLDHFQRTHSLWPALSVSRSPRKGCIGFAGRFGYGDMVIDHFPAGASRERLVTDGRQAEQSSIFLFSKLYMLSFKTKVKPSKPVLSRNSLLRSATTPTNALYTSGK
eukprot:scaffold333_cov230-Pinguiococcus_pyrenoidosus.AAC.3